MYVVEILQKYLKDLLFYTVSVGPLRREFWRHQLVECPEVKHSLFMPDKKSMKLLYLKQL